MSKNLCTNSDTTQKRNKRTTMQFVTDDEEKEVKAIQLKPQRGLPQAFRLRKGRFGLNLFTFGKN